MIKTKINIKKLFLKNKKYKNKKIQQKNKNNRINYFFAHYKQRLIHIKQFLRHLNIKTST